jgi:hypothetical protein
MSIYRSIVNQFLARETGMAAKRLQMVMVYLVMLGIAAVAIGCGRATEPQVKPKPEVNKENNKQATTATTGKEAQTEHADAAIKADSLSGLAELSVEDRVLAQKQKICPVTGEELGKHGKPIKFSVNGEIIFLCCSGCVDAIKKDPDKYLAKLKANADGAK